MIRQKQKYNIFVAPKVYTVSAGLEETYIMKVTNNKDIPLYQIHVMLEITSGTITTDNISIIPQKKPQLEVELGDEKGKVTVHWDNMFLHIKEKNKEYPTILKLIINARLGILYLPSFSFRCHTR